MLDRQPSRTDTLGGTSSGTCGGTNSGTTFATLALATFMPLDVFAQEPLPTRSTPLAISKPVDGLSSPDYSLESIVVASLDVPTIRHNASVGRYADYPAAQMMRQVAERQPGFQDFGNSATTLHENIHFLHAHLRETVGRRPEFIQERIKRTPSGTNERMNVVQPLWLGDGRVAMVKDPEHVAISDILPLVAESLRRSRADVYLRKDPERYRATYLLNEHAAYLLDAEYLIKVHDHIWKTYSSDPTKHESDAGNGAAEFIPYSLALAKAIESTPDSYADRRHRLQALAVIRELCERSATVYKSALNRERYPMFSATRRDYLANLRDKPDAEPLRAFAKRTFGERWFQTLVEH